MGGGGHVAYKISVGKPEGKRQLWRSRRRWGVSIKMDIKETWCEGVDWGWIPLAGYVNTWLMDPDFMGIILTSWYISALWEEWFTRLTSCVCLFVCGGGKSRYLCVSIFYPLLKKHTNLDETLWNFSRNKSRPTFLLSHSKHFWSKSD
jgi:hypothetical protein